jgi:hypothetical protein
MGFYYSKDGRYFSSSLSLDKDLYLNPKGLNDIDATIIIQRWWKQIKLQKSSELSSDSYCYMADQSDQSDQSNNSFECIKRSSYKNKLDEMSEAELVEIDSDLEIEQINSLKFELSESESESELESEVQTIINNSFLWDFFSILFSVVLKLFSY